MSWKACVICGECFDAVGKHKTCSNECRLENRRINRIKQKRRSRDRNTGRAIHNGLCVMCGDGFERDGRRKTCSCICAELLNTKTKVKDKLKEVLTVHPPDDLVEEATALRLLKRALRA